MKDIKTDSGASAKYKSYFTGIFLADREWIDQTKGEFSRPERIKEIIQFYKLNYGR